MRFFVIFFFFFIKICVIYKKVSIALINQPYFTRFIFWKVVKRDLHSCVSETNFIWMSNLSLLVPQIHISPIHKCLQSFNVFFIKDTSNETIFTVFCVCLSTYPNNISERDICVKDIIPSQVWWLPLYYRKSYCF